MSESTTPGSVESTTGKEGRGEGSWLERVNEVWSESGDRSTQSSTAVPVVTRTKIENAPEVRNRLIPWFPGKITRPMTYFRTTKPLINTVPPTREMEFTQPSTNSTDVGTSTTNYTSTSMAPTTNNTDRNLFDVSDENEFVIQNITILNSTSAAMNVTSRQNVTSKDGFEYDVGNYNAESATTEDGEEYIPKTGTGPRGHLSNEWTPDHLPRLTLRLGSLPHSLPLSLIV